MGKDKEKAELEKEPLEDQEKTITKQSGKNDMNESQELEVEQEEREEESEEVEEIDELSKTQIELMEMKEKYLRLYSEFENFRRRTAKEKFELINTANEGLLLSLLPVVDDFERADNAYSEESDKKSIKQGIDLIYNKLQNVLQQKALTVMDTKKGKTFDAELHDAITQIPAPSKKLKGKIIDTIEKGYSIGDKVIRHAKVVVGK